MAESFDTEALFGQAKKALRQRLRALRSALPEGAWRARNEAICGRLKALPTYEAARSVALFFPIEAAREVDLRKLDEHARTRGKVVFYPFMDRDGAVFRTGFRRVDDPLTLAERGRGFLEPPSDFPHARPGDIDFIVVPALAAAPSGHRLGYGAGFYDQTLGEFCPPAMTAVVVYDFQLLGELPSAPHDIACSFIVTDDRTLEATVKPATL